MPKTRTGVDRQTKVDEILAAAEKRLEQQGYDGLSMVGIARDLGVAQAAVYWYFPSRDHLFVAALERVLSRIIAKKQAAGLDLIDSILWFTDQLGSFARFRASIQERAQHSEVVAEFVTRFNEMLRTMLRGAFRSHIPEENLDLAIESFIATVEGVFLSRGTPKHRHQILEFTLRTILGDASSAESSQQNDHRQMLTQADQRRRGNDGH